MPHRNHGLFSDHYLGQHIPELAGDDLARAQSLQAQIADLCAKAEATLPGRREANARKMLITPVLELLGFACDDEPPLPTGMSTEAPDYALLASEEDEKEAEQHRNQPAQFYARVLALAEAKRWDRPLSATARKAKSRKDQRHPGKQTRDYLYESGVRWGILTNGRLWRLYEREASRGENYYEVDLPALASSDAQAWRYFYLFFRREAFKPDVDGRRPLDKWLAESKDYAVGLTQRLRGNVYEALRFLMEGYFAERRNGLAWEQDWQRVRDASLVLLYRLLFVLYAEARGLMPLTNLAYRDRYSLQRHKAQIAEQLDAGGYDEFGSGLWNWLRDELFELVDKGDRRLGVPQYNGGLFRAERWPLLHDAKIRLPDYHLAQAVDLLARDTPTQRGAAKGFLDYSELGVRELGSIYEGLLEMRPHLATEPMIEAKRAPKDKGLSLIPESQATEAQKAWAKRYGGKRYDPGQVYLLTDRGERKQTSSYYTPEYIVNYIVENTLRPLTNECAAKVAEQRASVEKQIAKREKVIAERGDEKDTTAERAAVERLKLELLAPYFDLKVLDPAMGSGHFLVGAADFITDAILIDPNHLPPEEADGDEALYYKRRVVERCLYGVDLNPLAVELAKLSLWLHTVQKDRALSFLDHHLRCGNSLMGAWIDELGQLPAVTEKQRRERAKIEARAAAGQAALNLYQAAFEQHVPWLLHHFRLIEERPTGSAAEEEEKRAWFAEVDARRERFVEVANLWLSTYFGARVENYDQAVDALRDEETWGILTRARWFREAQAIAAQRRFFHWELEFPELWFVEGRLREDPGFHAVIGNPPYRQASAVLEEEQSAALLSERRAIEGRGFQTLSGRWDLFVPFVERAVRLARGGAWCSQIISDGVNVSPYAEKLRNMLCKSVSLRRLDLMPKVQVFEEAGVHNTIYVAERVRPSGALIRRVHTELTFEGPMTVCELRCEDLTPRVFDPDYEPALEGLNKFAVPLGTLCYVCAGAQLQSDQEEHRGEFTKEDLLSTSPRHDSDELYVGGADVGRYCLDRLRYVAYDQYLSRIKRPRFRALFCSPKVMIGYTSGGVYDDGALFSEGPNRRWLFCNHNVLLAVPWRVLRGVSNRSISGGLRQLVSVIGERYGRRELESLSEGYCVAALAGVCLSRAVSAYTACNLRRSGMSLTEDQVKSIPVRRIHFTTPVKERGRLVNLLKGLYAKQASDEILTQVEALLPKDADADFLAFKAGATGAEEKSDVVHDLLGFLAQQMIEMNKGKQAETTRFLQWLETEIGRSIDDLRLKTKIRYYHDRDYDALLDAIRANDKLLGGTAHRSRFQDDLRREFEESTARLQPLNERLAATDRLIDQVVYRLYGLTEEEIAIVEGRD